MTRLGMAIAGLVSLALTGCELDGPPDPGLEFTWDLPVNFPRPRVPLNNPMSQAKVELGRHLFYDTRLSGNQTFSCATCHQQARAFADDRAVALGSTGQAHPRNSMGLTNVGYASVLTWGNPHMRTLERQAIVPMFGTQPVELGLDGLEGVMLDRLRADPRYVAMFSDAFRAPGDPFTLLNVTRALASFQRTLISGNSPYDRYRNGDLSAISESAKRGEALFHGERAECFHCHSAPFFTGSVDFEGKALAELEFFNNGLYNIDGKGGYPAPNFGLFEFTLRQSDMGKFKAPTLRNIELTAPYMHDGSIATLDDVITHYGDGGRTITSGPNAGVGADNPNKSNFIRGFSPTSQERQDLIAFLKSLTDSQFVADQRFSNPWTPR